MKTILSEAGNTWTREVEILREMQHENLVRLMAVEQEQGQLARGSTGQVLCMEFCAGGSLYSILEEPEHTYGLPEDEFLLVLFDVGMLFLYSFDSE